MIFPAQLPWLLHGRRGIKWPWQSYELYKSVNWMMEVSSDSFVQAGRWQKGQLQRVMDPLECAVAVSGAQKAAQAARR